MSSGRKKGKLNIIMWAIVFGIVIILCGTVAYLYAVDIAAINAKLKEAEAKHSEDEARYQREKKEADEKLRQMGYAAREQVHKVKKELEAKRAEDEALYQREKKAADAQW